MKTFFDSFQGVCQSTLGYVGYEKYCEPARKNLKRGANWFYSAFHPVIDGAKWSWTKTGEHIGEGGQCVLVVLVGWLAYNIFLRKNEKEAKKFSSPLHKRYTQMN